MQGRSDETQMYKGKGEQESWSPGFNRVIDAPHLNVAVCEEVLHKGAVRPGHSSVVDRKPKRKDVTQVFALARFRLCLQDLAACRVALHQKQLGVTPSAIRAVPLFHPPYSEHAAQRQPALSSTN